VTRDEAFVRIHAIMVELFELEPHRVVLEAHLVNDLDLDSIDALDMVSRLHELTGFRVEEAALRSIRTVNDVVDLVVAQLEAKK
jgi:acyl carrier protein